MFTFRSVTRIPHNNSENLGRGRLNREILLLFLPKQVNLIHNQILPDAALFLSYFLWNQMGIFMGFGALGFGLVIFCLREK
jgi:hypothetical protein